MRLNRLLWLVVALLLLAACDAQEWQTYRVDEEEAYMVALPESVEPQEVAPGRLVVDNEETRLELVRFDGEGVTYTIAHASLTDEVQSSRGIELLLDDVQRWIVEEGGFRPRELNTSALSWNGYPGRELRFWLAGEEQSARGQGYVLLLEEEVYLVIAAGPDEAMDERAQKFLASFTAGED